MLQNKLSLIRVGICLKITVYAALVYFFSTPCAYAQLDEVLHKAEETIVGAGETVDVDALIKKINSDLHQAEKLRFNGNIEESSDILDRVYADIQTVKQVDPNSIKLKGSEARYNHQRRDVDRRLARNKPPVNPKPSSTGPAAKKERPAASIPAPRSTPASDELPAGVTKRLRDIGAKEAAAMKKARKEAAREARVIDKEQAARDWALLDKLRNKHLRELSSRTYFTKAGVAFIAEWREFKNELGPLRERFRKTYGESYNDVAKSFEGVQKPLDAFAEITDLNNFLGYYDIERQEKTYVEWAVKRGRESYSRWKAMTNPDPTKYELKFDCAERALNSFKVARMLDPEGNYDESSLLVESL